MSGEHSKGLTGLLNTSTKDVLNAHYRVLRTISSGTFSEVKLAYHRVTGTKVFVKVMQKGVCDSHIESEISILKTLQHPNVARLLFVEETAEQVYLTLEYARWSLHRYVKTCRALDETEARNFFRQIAQGLAYCHQQGVTLLDVNPCNILLDDNYTIKICDFQMSTRFKVGEQLSKECGVWSYWAPEMFLHQTYHGPKADAWSLGGVLYFMIVGTSPSSGKNFKDIDNKVLSAVCHMPQQVSAECQNVLAQLLSLESSRRPTVEEILEHVWLRKGPPGPPLQALPGTPDPDIISAMAIMGYDPTKILQSLQTKEMNEASGTYLLFEEQARKQADGPIQLGPIQPGVTPCPSPTDLSTCSPPLRRTASAPALFLPFFLTSEFNHLSQDDDNSVKKGGARTFIFTNPLFNPRRKVRTSTSVPLPAPVDPEGGKSAELKSRVENTLPSGQSQDVIEGNHLSWDDNSVKQGQEPFITTNPLFNPRRKIPSTLRVSPPAPVDPERSKSAELKSPVENVLPTGQSQDVMEGATPNRSQGWRRVTRRSVANILRICCFLPSSNASHQELVNNKVSRVQQDAREQVELNITGPSHNHGEGSPRCGLKQ